MKKMKAPETDYKETQIVSQLTNKINFLIFLVRYIHHLKVDIQFPKRGAFTVSLILIYYLNAFFSAVTFCPFLVFVEPFNGQVKNLSW